MKWGFVGPVLVLLILFNVFPLFYNIILSFTDAELSGGETSWVGGDNYHTVFTDPEYGQAIRTTGVFVFFAVTIELVLGFILALSMKDRFPGKTVVLTILLVPMMLSPAVMGLFWNLMLNGHYGVVNKVLAVFGVPAESQPMWLTGPGMKMVSILIIDIWMWTPFMMLISLAGLNSIPDSLYEAAEIDRAGKWKIFSRITFPQCAPLLILAVLLRTTDALKQFDLVMAVTGPNDTSTQTLSALLYQGIFRNFKVGLGSAYACVTLVIVIALATVFTRYIDRIQRQQGRA